jgi:AraC family transcriptional regulator
MTNRNIPSPVIITLSPKLLVGHCMEMSLIEDHTSLLWEKFLPKQRNISPKVSNDFYSLQIYPKGFFDSIQLHVPFMKWALIEVSKFENIPSELQTLVLEGGLYAIFNHKGTSTEIFDYLYTDWIPSSIYQLDDRPHFEVLGKKYKNGDENSEEQIWIPLKLKS